MGYDINRFKDGIDEELLCSICSDVLQNPVQAPVCEHVFCEACISVWLVNNRTCPIDRMPLSISVLQQLPRIIRNLLNKQLISCSNAEHGCSTVVRLETLDSHHEDCEYNPNKPIECTHGCGLIIPKSDHEAHNCVRALRLIVKRQELKITAFELQFHELMLQFDDIRRQIGSVKEFVLSKQLQNINQDRIQFDINDLDRWSSNLDVANVERWGGVISTPDLVLQSLVKRALISSNCPVNIVAALMDNCHERSWPTGLNSLETRQMNRYRFDTYHAKWIPGKQAVVIMSCDNPDIGQDIMMQPGIVMIFANDVL